MAETTPLVLTTPLQRIRRKTDLFVLFLFLCMSLSVLLLSVRSVYETAVHTSWDYLSIGLDYTGKACNKTSSSWLPWKRKDIIFDHLYFPDENAPTFGICVTTCPTEEAMMTIVINETTSVDFMTYPTTPTSYYCVPMNIINTWEMPQTKDIWGRIVGSLTQVRRRKYYIRFIN